MNTPCLANHHVCNHNRGNHLIVEKNTNRWKQNPFFQVSRNCCCASILLACFLFNLPSLDLQQIRYSLSVYWALKTAPQTPVANSTRLCKVQARGAPTPRPSKRPLRLQLRRREVQSPQQFLSECIFSPINNAEETRTLLATLWESRAWYARTERLQGVRLSLRYRRGRIISSMRREEILDNF